MAEKRVTLTIEVDSHFIRMLNAQVGLSGGVRPDTQLTATAVLARVVLLEARGAPELQVHAATPIEWRPHIDVLHDERKVVEIG